MSEKVFPVPHPVMAGVIEYLASRPYREVAQALSVIGDLKPMELDQVSARALADAGYMPMDAYVRLCTDKGWAAENG